jgi:hypothetical protein
MINDFDGVKLPGISYNRLIERKGFLVSKFQRRRIAVLTASFREQLEIS